MPLATTEPQDARTEPRWYTHGWNVPAAWKLMHRVVPRLPSPLLGLMRHAVALVCFTVMRHERGAVRRNLRRVTGETGAGSLLSAYRVFHNFSRFLTLSIHLAQANPSYVEERLRGTADADATIRSALAEGNGLILLTMHLGHWDLGLRMLTRYATTVHVVMLETAPEGVARFGRRGRDDVPEIVVHDTGSTPTLALDLLGALRRGEIVAVQGDRAVGETGIATPFFGATAPLPSGPVRLAMAAGAPILPIAVALESDEALRLVTGIPIRPERRRGDEGGMDDAMRRMAGAMESIIAGHPEQWFNFFDVWPATDSPDRPASRRAGTIRRLVDFLLRSHTGTARLSVAVGLGVFIGLTPLYGLHALLGVAAAWLLRLNPAAVVLATQISNPLLAPLLIGASAWLGSLMEGAASSGDASWWDPTARTFYTAWLRGGLLLGLILGGASGVITFAILSRMRRRTDG